MLSIMRHNLISLKTLNNIDFLVNNDIGHLLKTSLEYFDPLNSEK